MSRKEEKVGNPGIFLMQEAGFMVTLSFGISDKKLKTVS